MLFVSFVVNRRFFLKLDLSALKKMFAPKAERFFPAYQIISRFFFRTG